MDTKKDNSDILELLGKAWNDKDGKIVIITSDQEEQIRQLIRSRRNTQRDKLFWNKAFMLAFCGIALFVLLAHLRLYITDIKFGTGSCFWFQRFLLCAGAASDT